MKTNCKKYIAAAIAAAMLTAVCGVTAYADRADAAGEKADSAAAVSAATVDTPEREDVLRPAQSPLSEVPEEQKQKRMGDLDMDDVITSGDALGALRASVFRNVKPLDKQLSDIDADGVVTSSDALQILRSSAGFEVESLKKPENVKINWVSDSSGKIFGRLADGSIPAGILRVEDYLVGFNEDGSLISGSKRIDGKRYSFTEDGVLLEGWQNEDGSIKYYVRGRAKSGWTTVFDQQFYLDGGSAVTGWQELDGKKMYFNEYGLVSMGITNIGGKAYYFDESFDNKTGLLTINGDEYYFYDEGGMANGFMTLDGKKYYFLENGRAAVGFVEIDGDLYYFGEDHNAFTGKKTIGGDSFEFDEDGALITGWTDPEAHTHYIIDGANAVGFEVIDGVKYYFEFDGMIGQNMGVTDENGNQYYIMDDGRCAVGTIVIDGDTYIYNENGAMITGWLTIPHQGKYLYNGSVLTGLAEIDGRTYYFDKDGNPGSGFYTDSTGTYFKDENGVNQTGWIEYEGYTYYFDDSGRAVTGYNTIGGNLYYFDEYFRMLRNTSVGLYRIGEDGVCHKINIVDGSTIKYKADDIISQIGTSTSALCNYVHSHVSYYFINEPMVYSNPYAADWASIAAFAANRGYGACYHYSAFLHVLLQRAGYTSRIIVGTGFYPSLHSFNQVLIDGQWLTFDAYYNYQACSTDYMQSLGFTYNHFIEYYY